MQGNPNINRALNKVLRGQLVAINQYFLHARMSANWGLEQFNHHEYHRSIKAMKQADELIKRILFLEGLPNLQDLGKLYLGENIPEILVNDQQLSHEIIAELRAAILACEQAQDYVSRALLQDLLEEEEEQMDWLESQQWLLSHTGEQNYLQSLAAS